jgi:AsmA protein
MKRLLMGLIVVVLLVVVLGVGALLLVDANHFRPQIQATLGRALGREVTLGKLHASVWSASLHADEIRIGDDPAFGKQAFVSAQSLQLGVRLWPLLLHRQLQITSLTLDQPSVRLSQDRAGRWNFASLGGGAATAPPATAASPATASTPLAFSVDKLRIKDGRIDVQGAGGDARSYQKVQLSADHVGLIAAFPFSMAAAMAGGGTLQLDGRLGPWDANNAVLTPVDAHLVMHDLDLLGAGLVSRGGGVGGVLDIDSRVHSDHGVLQSKGGIDARQLKLMAAGTPTPEPIRIDYVAAYRLDNGRGRIDDSSLRFGATRVAISGSFDNRPQVMQLDLHINGKQLPVDDVQPLLPVFGVVLPKNSRLSGGRLGLDLRAQGPLDALVITGPVTLNNSRLAGFSLGSQLGSALTLAGIKAPKDTVIRHAEAALTIAPSGIRAEPMRAEVADLGNLTGQGGMAADGRLDFRMLVKLDKAITGAGQSGQGLAGLLGNSGTARLLGGVLGGTTVQGIGVHVTGTASAPSFKIDPAAVTSLIKAGVAGSRNTGAKAPDSGKSTRKKDVLDSLLKGALGPKSGH